MRRVRFIEPADVELEEAISYFDRQVMGLGARFQHEVENTVALIVDYPEIGAPLTKHLRKFRVRKFKHKIIYALDADEIVIIAVAPPKKRPNYWRRRISPKP